jgi:ribosome-associated protein
LSSTALRDQVVHALDDMKGLNIIALDVTALTNITDYMIIVSGSSNRHVKALVDQVIDAAREYGNPARGVEGRESNEWVLIDLGDVVVHVMQKQAREFYELERLWSELAADTSHRL